MKFPLGPLGPRSGLFLCVFGLLSSFPANAQTRHYSSLHRDGERALPQTLKAGAAVRARLAANRSGISLAVADFDADGTADLVTGYATSTGGALLLQRGSPIAFAPTPAEWAMTAAGQLVAPFSATAEAIETPVRPDFLTSADIHGRGHADILLAARNDTSIYLLIGDGRGAFSAPQPLPLSGRISSLAVWRSGPANTIVAGVCGPSGCGLQFIDQAGITLAFVPTSGPVIALQVASLDNGSLNDIAFIAGQKVAILDGESVLSGKPRVEPVPASSAVALATGHFAYDRRGLTQLAVLGADGTLHVLARTGVITTAPTVADGQRHRSESNFSHYVPQVPVSLAGVSWEEVETDLGVAPSSNSGEPALLLRGRLSGGGYDDLAILAAGQFITVAHPFSVNNGIGSTPPQITTDSTSGPVTAALATRIGADARQSVVTANGSFHPNVALIAVNKTFTVNTTFDALDDLTTAGRCTTAIQCTLRDAVGMANKDSANGQTKMDTINIPAGTYTLSANNGSATDSQGSKNIHLNIEASTNLVGAGSASTIINANFVDKVFSCNSGVVNAQAPFDIYFTNLTIRNGLNPNPRGTGANYFGGNMDFESMGPGNITFNNVILTGGYVPLEEGGGLLASNVNDSSVGPSTEGLVEVDNSTISNNNTPEFGGGLWIGPGLALTMTGSVVSGNKAVGSLNTSDPSHNGAGGGIIAYGVSNSGTTTITNSTFSGNTATESGGAAEIMRGLTMSGTTVSGNTAGSFGGGFYLQPGTSPNSILTSTFTGNALVGDATHTYGGPYQVDGGAICVDAGNTATGTNIAQLGLHYSRIHGNTATANATGLGVVCSGTATATTNVDASDNWWGCNAAATGAGCDTAFKPNPIATQVLTLSPYTTLALTLNATTFTAGATITGTGSLGQDSNSTVYTGANDAAYAAVPATLTIVQNGGGTTNSGATALSSTAAISTSATANAAGTGTATVTVDGASVSKTFTVTIADMTITGVHTGNFRAGDSADTYTLTATNSGTSSTGGTVTVVDTLPSVLTATAISGTGWTCTLATLTCTRSDALTSTSSYPAITVTVSVSSVAAGTYTNTATVSGGGETTTSNDTSTDATIIVGLPTIAEAFSPTSVGPGTNSAVTFTLGNPSANSVSLTGVAFSDTLPGTLKVSTPNGASTTCTSGVVTATAASSSISLSGATIAAGATCTVTVNVTSASTGTFTNVTGAVTATNSNAGGTASATLTVVVTPTKLVYTTPPATPINVGGNAGTITIALEDANNNVAAANSTSSVTVTVTGPASYSQTYTNTASSGIVTFVLGGVSLSTQGTYTYTATSTGLTPAAPTEAVVAPPTISAVFSPSTIAPNATSTLTFTLGNPAGNPVTLSGVAFTNALPSGLTIASPNGAGTTCTGGSLSAAAGSTSMSLSGASITTGATCTVSVNVTGSAMTTYNDTSSSVTATNSASGTTASASLTITVTPTKLVFTQSPATPIAAGTNAGTIRIALEDGANNVATNNSSSNVTVTVTGPSGYSQPYSATPSNGVVTFNLSSVALTAAGTYTYTATSSGLTQAAATEVVNAAAASSLQVAGPASSAAPGQAGTYVVTAIDSFGNIATGFTGTVTITSSDSAATLPSPYTFVSGDNGVHSFTVTLNTSGTQTVTATAGALTGSQTGIVVANDLWVLNANNTLARLSDLGSQTTTAGSAGTAGAFGALAVDNAGNIWSVENGLSTVNKYSSTGAVVSVAGSSAAGVNLPVAIAIDGLGQVWVANTNNSVSQLSPSGAAVTPSTGYQSGALNAPTGVIVDPSGSVWLTNSGNNSVTKIIGAGVPVVAPTITGTINKTLGTRP
jgi:hypothetical protein